MSILTHLITTRAAQPESQMKKPRSNSKRRRPRMHSASPKRKSNDTTSASSNNSVDKMADFTGEVDTNDLIPSPEVLSRIASLPVLDKDGKSRSFRSLYSGPDVATRVLVIFVRHFFCGVSNFTSSSMTLPTTNQRRTAKNTFALFPSPSPPTPYLNFLCRPPSR